MSITTLDRPVVTELHPEWHLSERVAAGVAWLDEVHPGWLDRVDLQVLDIFSTDQCVVGQLGLQDTTTPSGRTFDPALGFDAIAAGLTVEEYNALTVEWKRVICQLRQERKP